MPQPNPVGTRVSLAVAFAVLIGTSGTLSGQTVTATQRAALAEAIEAWVDSFEAGAFDLADRVDTRHPAYVQPGIRSGAFEKGSIGTHLAALYKLMALAELTIDKDLARAILRVASVGIDKGLYHPDHAQVRDLGHWTLMRSEDRVVWFHILTLAAGDRRPWDPPPPRHDLRDRGPLREAAMQVAALRLLGQRNRPVFRATVEAQLDHEDTRVRLAAVEAMATMGRTQSLDTFAELLRRESHPVVAAALVQGAASILDRVGDELAPEEREPLVRAAVGNLGLHGWRYDLQAIDLGQTWPYPDLIPVLILTMERAGKPREDQLLAKVGTRSSLRVRHRAWLALQSLIGTLIPQDDPEQWREFWQRERDNIDLPTGRTKRPVSTGTRAQFFGIPIEGSEIGFVIDTSGSMDNQVVEGTTTGRRRPGSQRRPRTGDAPTRLDKAKEQIAQAVEHMDPEMRYHLFTFSDEVWNWNKRSLAPTRQTNLALTRTLGRFQAKGGTNIWDALTEVLQTEQQVFGEPSDNPLDELFILSDGEPTTGETDREQILEMVRTVNRYQAIKINVVFTGEGTGSDFLRRLAEDNGGVFVQR